MQRLKKAGTAIMRLQLWRNKSKFAIHNKGDAVSETPPAAKIADENGVKAISTVMAGKYIYHNAGANAESSVGWRVIVDGTTGFLTCGHNWQDGSSAYYDGTLLGKIDNHFSTSENTDISFIPSTAAFYGMRKDGKKITHAGIPVSGSSIIMDGARHYQDSLGRINAKITAINGTAYQVDILGRKVNLTGLIVFDQQPLKGDSGAAIIQERDNMVVLVGFNSCQYKAPGDGKDEWNYGAAVTWASARDALGGSSSVLPTN